MPLEAAQVSHKVHLIISGAEEFNSVELPLVHRYTDRLISILLIEIKYFFKKKCFRDFIDNSEMQLKFPDA